MMAAMVRALVIACVAGLALVGAGAGLLFAMLGTHWAGLEE